MEEFNHIFLKGDKIEVNLDNKPSFNKTGDLNKDIEIYSWESNKMLINFANGEMHKIKKDLNKKGYNLSRNI